MVWYGMDGWIMVGNVQILGKVPEMSRPNRADNTDINPNECPHRHSEAKAEEEKQLWLTGMF
jgi:hypothetical protein